LGYCRLTALTAGAWASPHRYSTLRIPAAGNYSHHCYFVNT